MEAFVPKPENIEVMSVSDLKLVLDSYGIDYSIWGSEDFVGSRTVDDFYEEIESGSSRLGMRDGELFRFRSLAAIDVFAYEHNNENGDQWYKLKPFKADSQYSTDPGIPLPTGSDFTLYVPLSNSTNQEMAYENSLLLAHIDSISNKPKIFHKKLIRRRNTIQYFTLAYP